MNILFVDTETTNTIDDPLAFDLSYLILDLEKEKILKAKSYLVKEVWEDEYLMSIAYYAKKIPNYLKGIQYGYHRIYPLQVIQRFISQDIKYYNISEFYAHNAAFDARALNKTLRYITNSEKRFFLPYGIKICDTLKMSRLAFNNCPDYTEFCKKNNYLTSQGKNRLTAEILYKFISKDNNFIEVHEGLADCMIEKEILFECRRRGITDGILWK